MSSSRSSGGGGGPPQENNPNLKSSPSLGKCINAINAAVVAPFAPSVNGESASPEAASSNSNFDNAPNVGTSGRQNAPPVPSRSTGISSSASKSSLSSSAILLGEFNRQCQSSKHGHCNEPNVDGTSNEDSKATVRQRNAAMLFSELIADVWFVVGSQTQEAAERIPAHSYVLATGSSVFYAMFFGGFSKDTDVEVPDVESKAFRILLRYLYTDEIHLSLDTVLPTLYAAKKYLVNHLIRTCVCFLEATLTASNVCLLLSQRRLFEEENLMDRCWELIDAQTELVLRSDGFIDLDLETVKLIFDRDSLNVRSDIAVFEAALRWADAECDRRLLEPNTANRRIILEPILEKIRFVTMPVEDFANGPAQSGLLDSAEVADIFLYFFARDKPTTLRFVSRPRTGLQLRRCHRFQSCAYASNQWRHRGRCDSIQFSTDRRIFVAGLGLYGSSSGSAEFKVCIELKKGGQSMAIVNSRLFCDGSSNVFPVYFVEPVQIEPDILYTASAVLEGGELSYFGQDGQSEVTADHVTFQYQCSTESTNGTVVQGGQIPEILFYCGR